MVWQHWVEDRFIHLLRAAMRLARVNVITNPLLRNRFERIVQLDPALPLSPNPSYDGGADIR